MTHAEAHELETVARAHLGLTKEDIQAPLHRSMEQAQRMLAELKARTKKVYKRKALELHPDRTGGDETKAALFVKLTRVMEELEKLQLEPVWRPPMSFGRVVIIQWDGFGGVDVGTSASTTSGSGTWGPAF